ncbi:MAG TPA: hypothetical protein VKQ72_23670 [Aggregatilineales bacterium]|nr:hypothetical protein [Aggregatilineales bacterium]
MNLQNFLAQNTPWGLTVAQTGAIGVVALVLLIGWFVVHTTLRLTGTIFRLGCAALLVFICGIISFMVLYNLASKY